MTQREAKRYLDEAASCITHLEDLLLALAASGSLSRVILSLTDCPYGVREKEPFHKVISRFGKAFPRLRKQGILEYVSLDVCHIRWTFLIHKTDFRACSESSF